MGLSTKPYPCCRMTHSSIDDALGTSKSCKIDPGMMRIVTVSVSKMVFDMVGAPFKLRANPQVDAQFSIPYTVAVALKNGKVSLDSFRLDTVQNSHSVLELAKKVKVNAAKRSPNRPMSFEECSEKFSDCLKYSGNPPLLKNQDTIVDLIYSLDKVENVKKLLECL